MRKQHLGSPVVLCSCLLAAPALLVTPAAAQSGAGPGVPESPSEAALEAPTQDETAPEAEAPSPSEQAPEPVAEPEPEAAPSEANVGGAVQFGPGSSAASANANANADAPAARGGGQSGSTSVAGPATSSDEEWKFSFNGYFRAPMRIGIGERNEAKSDQAETTLSQPQIPDDQYLSWQYTKQNQRSWAEMFFGYGSKLARGTLAIQAFNFTDAGYNDQDAQFGVGQAWVELTPDMDSVDPDMRLSVRGGTFWGRYGGAGRYDAGAYDTFIFGRTHSMGENVRLEYDWQDFVFYFEEGFGTKEPNPDPNHNTKFTLVAHAHAGFNWQEFLEVGAHYLVAWTQEPDHECTSREEQWVIQGGDLAIASQFSDAPVGACKQEDPNTATATSFARADSPDGSMQVFGADAVLNTTGFGRIYAGFSRIVGSHAVTVAPAIEVVHSNGGGFFNMGITHQFFLERQNWEPQDLADQMNPQVAAEFREVRNSYGNGTVDTIAGQWDLSLASLMGDALAGQQLDLKLFGMLNLVKSEDDEQLANISKLKFGTEILYSPLAWMGVGGRFDRVAPRSDVPEQTFMALGPRVIFRSAFATHEEIAVGFSHYLYAQHECARDGSDPDFIECVQPPGGTVGQAGFYYRPGINAPTTARGGPVEATSPTGPFPDKTWDPPHENTFYISASMWW